MKRLLLVAVAAVIFSSSTGCCLIDRMFFVRRSYPLGARGACQGYCNQCGAEGDVCQCGWGNGGRHRALAARRARDEAAAYGGYGAEAYGGGPQGAVAYPYYTNRGPRDFLAKNPPSIGP